MTFARVADTGRSGTSGVTATTDRSVVNPHAAIGALVLWLRDEGVRLAAADQSPEARRRRTLLMRALLAEFGVTPASAEDRAAGHAAAKACRPVTATLPPLGPTSPVWEQRPEVVTAIATGPGWALMVAAAAHDLAHPRPISGCPGCPQAGMCDWCRKPAPECPDPAGHYRRARASEESLLSAGTALCGGDRL